MSKSTLCGTFETVKARFRPWLAGQSRRGSARAEDAQETPAQSPTSPIILSVRRSNLLRCSLFAWLRLVEAHLEKAVAEYPFVARCAVSRVEGEIETEKEGSGVGGGEGERKRARERERERERKKQREREKREREGERERSTSRMPPAAIRSVCPRGSMRLDRRRARDLI